MSKICEELIKWLGGVVFAYIRELYTPDLWEQFKQYQPFISDTAFSKDDFQPFLQKKKKRSQIH